MRKLVAILFSDVEGYSRQMSQDERGTLARLEIHNGIMREQLQRRGGRIVKTVGDAFMVEFGSVVAAVEAALAAQRELGRKSDLRVRMGVHLGDVVVREGDLFGDTVNLAARLEPKAPVGGVCVAAELLPQLVGRVQARAQDLGVQALKNIPRPMQLYALLPADSVLAAPPPPAPAAALTRSRVLIAAGALAVLVIGSLVAQRGSQKPEAASTRRGGTLRVGATYERGPLRVFTTWTTLGSLAVDLVTERLLERGEDGEPRPSVIDRWSSSDDGKAMDLHLRKGVWFHAHPCLLGARPREATPDDVLFSLVAARRAGMLPLPFANESLASIQGDGTLRLRFLRPSPLTDMALTEVPLLPRELQACDNLDDMKQPVGTDAFQMVQPSPGDGLTVTRAPRWWGANELGANLPHLDSVEFLHFPDEQSAIAALARGQIDLFSFSSTQGQQWLELSNGRPPRVKASVNLPGVRVSMFRMDGRAGMVALVPWENTVGPLQDVRVRRALHLVADGASCAAKLPGAVADKRVLLPPLHGSDAVPPIPQSELVESRRLIAQAGPLRALRIMVRHPNLALAEDLVKQAQRIGLTIELVETSVEGMTQARADHSADGNLMLIIADVRGLEPYPYVQILIQEYTDLPPEVSAGFDVDLEALMQEPDRGKRFARYGGLQKRMIDELPLIPLCSLTAASPIGYQLVGPRVGGIIDPVTGLGWPGRRMWLEAYEQSGPASAPPD